MTNTGIPRLCGGTVFTLILEARQQRYGVREHFAGDSDGLSEMDTLIGLAQVIVPDLKRPAKTREDTVQGNTTEFKICKTAGGKGYYPFSNRQSKKAFDDIQDFGVNLICVEDGIDSSKDSGKLTITVLSAVAEIERENILVQTMEGRRQKAREGKWNGGQAPFGYTLDSKNSTLIVNPEEAEIVKIIFTKFAHEGLGADRICDYLNQHGYTKKKVKKKELNRKLQ